jgi:hypothetical protein
MARRRRRSNPFPKAVRRRGGAALKKAKGEKAKALARIRKMKAEYEKPMGILTSSVPTYAGAIGAGVLDAKVGMPGGMNPSLVAGGAAIAAGVFMKRGGAAITRAGTGMLIPHVYNYAYTMSGGQ